MNMGMDMRMSIGMNMTTKLHPTHIIIHHSATADSGTVSWQAIRNYHINTQKWNDIGYHFGIELINNEYEIMIGRPITEYGAHCKELQMNRRSIGVCCIGNYDDTPPPVQLLSKLEYLVLWLMNIYHIRVECVLGHREVGEMAGFDWKKGQYKSCPGTKFNMRQLRDRLLQAMP